MNILATQQEEILGLEDAGVLMTPEEFDAIEDYDENYRYELINGVLVVSPMRAPEDRAPNDLLGYLLWSYQSEHSLGSSLDDTLPQEYVRTSTGRRIADRLIWAGLGRQPNVRRELPTIVVEFVSAADRSRKRDYVDKRREYAEVGIAEYWIFDRFQRTLTVIHNRPAGVEDQVIAEKQTYQSSFLPGFEVPVARLLAAADRHAESE